MTSLKNNKRRIFCTFRFADYTGTNKNLYNGTYADNTYTTGGDWEAMQDAGAVFLPATGYLSSGSVSYFNKEAHYWSSTLQKDSSGKACYLQITKTGVAFYYIDDVAKGNPVRLITVVQ